MKNKHSKERKLKMDEIIKEMYWDIARLKKRLDTINTLLIEMEKE